MNKHTLKKLKHNPHYKLNRKQLRELDEVERESMIEFGTPKKHDNKFEKHPAQKRRKRTS